MTKSKILSIILCLTLMSLAGNVSAEPSAGVWEERATVNELHMSLDFWDSETGLSAGAKNLQGPRILKTTDAGYTWTSVLSTMPNLGMVAVAWEDENTAYASGTSVGLLFDMKDAIVKTTDQGATWEPVWSKTMFAYWTDLQVLGPDTIVATGHWTPFFYTDYGIAYSTNGGRTWDERKWNWNWDTMDIGAWPSDLHFLDENVGYIAGGVWPWTKKGGPSGRLPYEAGLPKQSTAPGDWRAIAEKTTDQGFTWTTIFDEVGFALTDICFVNQNEGWVTGYYDPYVGLNNGWIWHTEDGGATWKQQIYGLESVSSIFEIHMFNRREGWAAGYREDESFARALLYHTTDGGETWVEEDFHPFADLMKIFFFDESEGWAVGMNGMQQSKFLHYGDPARTPKFRFEVTASPKTYTPGGLLTWKLAIENVSGQPQQGDFWIYLSSPAIGAASPYPIRLAEGITFPAGLNIEPTISFPLPAFLPPGTYNIEAIIGPFGSDDPLQHLAYAGFDVEFQ